MTRPERQLKVLKEKIADKASLPNSRNGKKAKRWKKWAAKYQPPAA